MRERERMTERVTMHKLVCVCENVIDIKHTSKLFVRTNNQLIIIFNQKMVRLMCSR